MNFRARRRFRLAVSVFALGIGGAALWRWAFATPAGCLEIHMLEAMAINEDRRQLYSELTQGASDEISSKLINSERFGRWVGRWFDRSSHRLQVSGAPDLMCENVISMNKTPAFVAQGPAAQVDEPLPLSDSKAFRASMEAAWQTDGFGAVQTLLAQELARLESYPNALCMSRHLLESMQRTVFLAPHQMRRARASGADPEAVKTLAWDFVQAHLWGLDLGQELDRLALPLNKRGIPIICNDVPKIPNGAELLRH